MNKSRLRTVQVAIILAVPALLLSIISVNSGQAKHDTDRLYCGTDETKWDRCFDCSLNPDHRFCSWEYIDRDTPYPKYAWITFALDAECRQYIADRRYSSTPCSLVVPDNATDQVFRCARDRLCESFNPDEPYELSVNYHIDNKTQDIRLCSSAPCSEDQATVVDQTSWGQIKTDFSLSVE